MMLGVLLAICWAAPDAIPEIAPLRVDAPATESYLHAHPELTAHHAGYLRFLNSHSDLAAAEQDWWELNALGRFAPLAENFDDALAADPDAARLFEVFYGNFATGAGADWTDRLKQFSENEDLRKDTLRAGVEYLRVHPESLLPLLRNDYAGVSVPEVLRPLQDYVQANPQAMEAVRNVLRSLAASNPRTEDLMQFWSGRLEAAPAGTGAFADLASYFRLHPAHFWRWHQRNMLLANNPGAAAWIRWWQQRVRRDAALRDTYFPYLAHVGRQRGIEGLLAPFAQVEEKAWPPAGAPPALPAAEPPAKTSAEPRRLLQRPEKPLLQRPEKPARPEKPVVQLLPPRPARGRD